jgi:cobalt/nickel transport system ATP-binding protein
VRELSGRDSEFTCDLPAIPQPAARSAPVIRIQGLSFHYPGGRAIFQNADFKLEPARGYRLIGPNGAGKTTLFKLLAGVLAPVEGGITLDGTPYAPWRRGNRVFALATQNPDHQWCGATLAEDLARRRAALARFPGIVMPEYETFAALAACLGTRSVEQHLYELPLVARKRLSWLWPLSGAMPWIMLDEPTLGQDPTTREALADAIRRLASSGYGIVFITHDDDFAMRIAHRPLRISDGLIS